MSLKELSQNAISQLPLADAGLTFVSQDVDSNALVFDWTGGLPIHLHDIMQMHPGHSRGDYYRVTWLTNDDTQIHDEIGSAIPISAEREAVLMLTPPGDAWAQTTNTTQCDDIALFITDPAVIIVQVSERGDDAHEGEMSTRHIFRITDDSIDYPHGLVCENFWGDEKHQI